MSWEKITGKDLASGAIVGKDADEAGIIGGDQGPIIAAGGPPADQPIGNRQGFYAAAVFAAFFNLPVPAQFYQKAPIDGPLAAAPAVSQPSPDTHYRDIYKGARFQLFFDAPESSYYQGPRKSIVPSFPTVDQPPKELLWDARSQVLRQAWEPPPPMPPVGDKRAIPRTKGDEPTPRETRPLRQAIDSWSSGWDLPVRLPSAPQTPAQALPYSRTAQVLALVATWQVDWPAQTGPKALPATQGDQPPRLSRPDLSAAWEPVQQPRQRQVTYPQAPVAAAADQPFRVDGQVQLANSWRVEWSSQASRKVLPTTQGDAPPRLIRQDLSRTWEPPWIQPQRLPAAPIPPPAVVDQPQPWAPTTLRAALVASWPIGWPARQPVYNVVQPGAAPPASTEYSFTWVG